MDEHIAFLRKFLAAGHEMETGLAELFTYCREIKPEAPWGFLEGFDVQHDVKSFEQWLKQYSPAGSERDEIAAFYFGLTDDGTAVHLDGTDSFDAADETMDWACEWSYRSEEDWSSSHGLQIFAAISAEADDEVPVLLYLLCLGYLGLMVKPHLKELGLPVAIGFDDGDAYLLV